MENGFFNKISEEVWGKWCSIPIFLFVTAIIAIPFYIGIVGVDDDSIKAPLLVVLAACIMGINVWNIFFVYGQNSIRKAAKNKTGIILFIDAADKDTYKSIKRKFGDEMEGNLFAGFDLIFAPYGMHPVKYRSKEIVKFLQKRRSLLFLNIGINSDSDGTLLNYDMKIKGAIIHPTYKPDIEKEFARVFSRALNKYCEVDFSSKDMIQRMQVTATGVSIACEYVIGLSLFLNGNFDRAENVLKELLTKVVNNADWPAMDVSIIKMRFEMFVCKTAFYMEKYERVNSDEEMLEKMNENLEFANSCIKNTAFYHLNKAYYCIAHDGDSQKAREHINICKQEKNASREWKYSEAFLLAYDNRSLTKICSSYNQALRVPYNIQDLIIFIEKVLNKEPNRTGLYLALGILYKSIDDEKLQNESIETYIASVSDPQKIKQQLIKKKLYV